MPSKHGEGSLCFPVLLPHKSGDVSGEENGGDGDGGRDNGYLELPGPMLTGSGDGGIEHGKVVFNPISVRRGREREGDAVGINMQQSIIKGEEVANW